MRHALLLLSLLLPGCIHVQKPVAPEVPATGAPVAIETSFAPAGGPVDGKLYVCGLIDPKVFWCLDYETFQDTLIAAPTVRLHTAEQ